MEHNIFLAIGGNAHTDTGNSKTIFTTALAALPKHGIQVQKCSRWYRTKAMYEEDQPDFLNGALQVASDLPPYDVLKALKELEADAGRDFSAKRYTQRPLDLDILFYGDQVINTLTLQIPHPLLQERAFVLQPLADIAPGVVHPVLGKTIEELYAALTTHASIFSRYL